MFAFAQRREIWRNFEAHVAGAAGMSAASGATQSPVVSMLISIVKIPPATMLEGLDLRPYRLRHDEVRELPRPVANVLLAWGYAEPCADRRRPGNPRIPPSKKRGAGKNKKQSQ
jgi:hypothetical protein